MRKAGFLILLLPLLVPSLVMATDVHVSSTGDSNVSVNSTSNGTSTTCINGDCTTSGGGSKTTVCVNGKCTDSDGDVDIEENGTSVHIKNTTPSTSSGPSANTKNSSNTKIKINTDNDMDEDDNKATEAAKKVIKKIQESRKSFLDQIREILRKIFPFI